MLRVSRVGLAACAVGLALAGFVQVAGPSLRPPLYDGVVTVEPYVYLEPAGSQDGGPKGATRTFLVTSATSPTVTVATPEQPPQAQLIAGAGSFTLPAGTTSIVVTISPVVPAALPPTGAIAGNVYRVVVENQAGAPVIPEADKEVTIALRDPGSTDLARIERLSGGSWQALPTVSASVSGTYVTTGLTMFGDFALVGTGATGDGSGSSVSPLAIVTVAAVALALLLAAAAFLRERSVRPRRPG